MAETVKQHYITIQEFMVKDLELKGNELIAYALIYGFSQDEESYFKGSLSYVANWLNCSKTTAHSILNKLADDGFLEKKEKNINGVKLCDYAAVVPNKTELKEAKERKENRKEKEKSERRSKKLNTPSKNLNEGVQKTLTQINNNILDDNSNFNSKANSFFTKKVRDRNKVINPSEINQDELKQRIERVADYLEEDIFTEEQTENIKSCMIYFFDKYAEVFNKKHPLIAENTINDVIARITDEIYIEHKEFTTCFKPLISDFEGDTAYEEIIDMYFETEFKQDIDYSIVHFSQKNVLTKLMGKATGETWFTNE